jgi:hypothetical protein
MVLVHRQAHFEHGGDHLGADVLGAVDRRDREIAALGAGTVAQIATFIFVARIGGQLDIVDLEVAGGVAVLEPHVVEHEEFGLGADEHVSPMPVCFRNASARLAVERGSRPYSSPVEGSTMSQMMISIGVALNGST